MRRYSLPWLVLVVMLVPGHADAARWQEVGKTPAMTTYADVHGARTENGYRLIWTLTAYQKVRSVAGKSFRSVKMLHYIDCGRRKIATKTSILYAGADGRGAPVIHHDFNKLVFKPEPPGSIGDLLIRKQCE